MAERAKFTAIAPTFVVADVVTTAKYYRDVLGFEILGFFAEPPVYAMVRRDAAEIHFGLPDSKQVSESVATIRKVGCDVYVWVSDIKELFGELSSSGAEIVEGPVKRVYESTEVVIRDCNGLTIVFGD